MKKVGGLIAYYKLQDWWFSNFTEEERKYIDDCYQPMGGTSNTLTRGTIIEMQQPAPEFLNGLNTWFRSSIDASIAERVHQKLKELAEEHPINKPGYYNGRHFTTYVKDYEDLKRSGDFQELESLLMELVKATEADSTSSGRGVAPAYYSELAILYRKQKEYNKEVDILERFAKQKHSPGAMPAKLLERLSKAQGLAANQAGNK